MKPRDAAGHFDNGTNMHKTGFLSAQFESLKINVDLSDIPRQYCLEPLRIKEYY